MRNRCHNKRAADYQYYGAKGIGVCLDWNVFGNFKNWALNHNYADHLTIDRINHRLGYFPDNCQWISQGDNARKAIKVRMLERSL
jgi:hypothetical protein